MKTTSKNAWWRGRSTQGIWLLACLSSLLVLPQLALAAAGVDWQWVNPLPQGNNLNAVAYDGVGTYVSVGMDGAILSSADGASWTVQTSGTTSELQAVAWGGTQFAAVGDAGAILTSTDGVNWTAQTSTTAQNLFGVVWDGGQWVAVGAAGTVLSSPDGVNWTDNSPGITVTTQDLYGVTWNGAQFVAVGAVDTVSTVGTVITSPDGVTWTAQDAVTLNDLRGVVWSGSQFVAVGAAVGLATAFALQYWISVYSYPLNIGGRPLNSWPAFVPVMFELTVLFASFSALGGMLFLNRLPRPHHPLFAVKQFERVTVDRFFLLIKSDDDKFDHQPTRAFLEGLGPHEVLDVDW